jgi:hypothetical protein
MTRSVTNKIEHYTPAKEICKLGVRQTLQANSEIVLELGHNRFLPSSRIYLSSTVRRCVV